MTWNYNQISGSRKGDMIYLIFNGTVSARGQGIAWPLETGNLTLPLEDGYIWDINEPGYHMIYRLSGSKIEKWRLVYDGYEVMRFTPSNSVRKDGAVDQLTGGLKVYWTNTVDFKVRKTKKGRKYLSGQGTVKVTHTEPYSIPAGIYKCSADENPIPVHKGTFAVNGSISKSKLKLNLPENGFNLTINCLLDSDALEKHLQVLAGKSILRDRFNGLILPHGTQSMNLVEHSETIHDYLEYGLKRTLRKLSGD